MNMSPTESRRTVALDIQTTDTDQPQPNRNKSAGTETVTCICIVIDDGTRVTEATFSGASEINLLREFWGAVQTDDLFYGYQVADRVALLRQRTWALDLVPARGLDLRTVYRHDTFDTAALPLSAGEAGYRSAQALASVLGLRTVTSNPGERPLRDAC
jgi:hypothetical protein